jgi:hypothetical protein
MTWSTRCAAACDTRRAPHEGQNLRRVQLKPWHGYERLLRGAEFSTADVSSGSGSDVHSYRLNAGDEL